MIIPNSTFKRWKILKDHGDINEIAEFAKVSPVTITRVFRDKKCKTELFNKIEKFFSKKEIAYQKAAKKSLDSLTSDIN